MNKEQWDKMSFDDKKTRAMMLADKLKALLNNEQIYFDDLDERRKSRLSNRDRIARIFSQTFPDYSYYDGEWAFDGLYTTQQRELSNTNQQHEFDENSLDRNKVLQDNLNSFTPLQKVIYFSTFKYKPYHREMLPGGKEILYICEQEYLKTITSLAKYYKIDEGRVAEQIDLVATLTHKEILLKDVV